MTNARARQVNGAVPAVDGSYESEIARAEVVRTEPNPNAPISIRLSAPLLERLDRLAEREHRKRSNLIQHILWEYVHAREQDV